MHLKTDNVVALFRAGFPVAEAEIIETLLMIATGDEISIEDVESTTKTLDELDVEFGVAPTMSLQGMAYPLWRWTFPLNQVELRMYVVDTGRYRAYYYQPQSRIRHSPVKTVT